MKRFLEASPHFPKNTKGEVHYSRIKYMLTRVIYTGYIHHPAWGIHLQEGQHEPLISFEAYKNIQERLNGQAKVPARKDINEDFPLRGFVTCVCCNNPMTSCWSQGSSQKYPYYLCATKGCKLYRKSIRKEQMEEDFEQLLSQMKPSKELLALALQMFRDLWNDKSARVKQDAQTLRREILKIERKTEQFFARILEADSPTIITAYENQIRKLEEEKIRIDENIAKYSKPPMCFEETFRTAINFGAPVLSL